MPGLSRAMVSPLGLDHLEAVKIVRIWIRIKLQNDLNRSITILNKMVKTPRKPAGASAGSGR
jgi:hypothetical protein